MKKLLIEVNNLLIDILVKPDTEFVDEETGRIKVVNYRGHVVEDEIHTTFTIITKKKTPAKETPIVFDDDDWIRKDWEEYTYDYGC